MTLAAAASPQQPAWSKWAWAIYLAVFAGGMLLCFHPTILSGFERMQAGIGDPVFNHYILEHTWRWVADRHYSATFWTPGFFHPTPHTLTYSENMIGTAPLYWGLRLVCSAEHAWQWWMILNSALNYAAMVVVLRWFRVNPILAALGGFLFAFGLPRQDQFGHQQLLPHVFAPLAAWYFWSFTREPQRRSWFLLLLLTAWQLLASIHHGWFLLFGLGVWLLVAIVFDRGTWRRCWGFVRGNRGFLLITIAVCLLGLGAFFRNYYQGNQTLHRSFHECLFYMPTPSTWMACPAHTLWDLQLAPGEAEHRSERHLGMGLGIIIITLGGIIWSWMALSRPGEQRRALLGLTALSSALFLIAVTLRIGDKFSMWYPIFECIPGANSIRAVGRINFTVMLFGLIGGLVAAQGFLDSRFASWRTRSIVSLLALLVCAAEQIRTDAESFARREFYPNTIELAKELTEADVAVVMSNPETDTPDYLQQTSAMWAGMIANVPLVNGYSGRWPDNYTYPSQAATPAAAAAAAALSLGETWRGRLLVVEPGTPPRRHYYDVRDGQISDP